MAAAFASGLAAATAVFQALAPNDHVVAPREAYYGVLRLLREVFARWRLAVDFVDMTDLGALKKGRAQEHENRLGGDAFQSDVEINRPRGGGRDRTRGRGAPAWWTTPGVP